MKKTLPCGQTSRSTELVCNDAVIYLHTAIGHYYPHYFYFLSEYKINIKKKYLYLADCRQICRALVYLHLCTGSMHIFNLRKMQVILSQGIEIHFLF